MALTELSVQNYRALKLHNEQLSLTVLPDLGAKVISLYDLQTGYEWLEQQPKYPLLAADKYVVGSEWTGREGWGWDECFPNVARGEYPLEPCQGQPLADHGELWSRAWEVVANDQTITTRIPGFSWPYLFERELHLENNSVIAKYQVTNKGTVTFASIWAMHSVFKAVPGATMVLPPVTLHHHHGTTLSQPAAQLGWTLSETSQTGLTLPTETRAGYKLFTAPLSIGQVSLRDPDGRNQLDLAFETKHLPYLGLWLNYKGWPGGDDALYHVALEPTTSDADNLAEAVEKGHALQLAPGATVGWQIRLTLTDPFSS